ncbi:MAG: D-alanyl-D-alanine carboxypeptidase family protein [Burkholderiales bacterium]|nr:D-alanyl-D-alanine carboxypeptidase family protein [Burkholderiales bacterium]MDP2397992.1 D-alanyl-D-alanine carboxypeptidase family protein [Burkholderiales bacterium]
MTRIFLAALLGIFALQSWAQVQPPAPAVEARAWLLFDVNSGQVLASRNASDRFEPASLTKVMTAYLVFGALKQKSLKPEQVVPVSTRAWKAAGSRMFIEPNKPVTVDELVRGMIIQSGNDASIALAEAVAGSEEVFAQMMNREAKRLGLTNTNFTNATGLTTPQLHSSAEDLAKLVVALIRDYPEHYPLYSQKEYRFNNITQANRNRLLWLDPTVDGVKTGYTENAGYCLVTSARRGERRLVSVVLGAASESARVTESQKLLNWGFQFYDSVKLYAANQPVTNLRVWKGSSSMLKAGFTSDLFVAVPKGQGDKVKAVVESLQPLLAPVSPGQRVATLKIEIDGKPHAELPVVALENVPAAGFFGRAWDSLRLLF